MSRPDIKSGWVAICDAVWREAFEYQIIVRERERDDMTIPVIRKSFMGNSFLALLQSKLGQRMKKKDCMYFNNDISRCGYLSTRSSVDAKPARKPSKGTMRDGRYHHENSSTCEVEKQKGTSMPVERKGEERKLNCQVENPPSWQADGSSPGKCALPARAGRRGEDL